MAETVPKINSPASRVVATDFMTLFSLFVCPLTRLKGRLSVTLGLRQANTFFFIFVKCRKSRLITRNRQFIYYRS